MDKDEPVTVSNEKESENVDINKITSSDSEHSCPTQKYELSSLLKSKLLEMPDVLEFIVKLQTCVERQRKKIKKLKQKLKKRLTKCESTQTMIEDVTSTKNISEEIKEAAELAMRNTAFVYEETSGLYYDYQSGYYYNAEYGLYYDGNTGTYLSYNAEKQTYEFHSKVEVSKEYPEKQKRKNDQGKQQVITSSTMENLARSFNLLNIKSLQKQALDISKHWPPCMRIIVEETTVPSLKVGSLYIVTFKGATIGREGDHDILIRDINVSKHHLKFAFDSEAGKYLAVDLGSRNGTLLNGKRMAASKQESEALEVLHGSRIQIGTSILLCHVHSGNQTCGLCEPGLIQTKQDARDTAKPMSKIQQHKLQLKNLRKKFGVNQNDYSGANLATGYTDRAQARRETVGSQNEHEKTQVASLDQSISSENKGFKLLSKLGWAEGQALGKEGVGLLEPIKPVSNPGTSGMGSTPVNVEVASGAKSKKNVWAKTQQRYEQLKLPSEDIFSELD